MECTRRSTSFVVSIVCLALAGALLRPADAQNISGKPIRILVGVAAGGATDVTARLIAHVDNPQLGVDFVADWLVANMQLPPR